METYISSLMTAIGILVALTNIIVEVLKKLIPNDKLPTNILAVVTAVVLTVVAFLAYCSYAGVQILWYYIVGVVVCGILVAYAAMFGYDKLMEIFK